jgi:hypothetical protein
MRHRVSSAPAPISALSQTAQSRSRVPGPTPPPRDGTTPRIEIEPRLEKKDTAVPVERTAPGRQRSCAVQRLERCQKEIARTAEVGEGALVLDPSDLLSPGSQERSPEVGDERPFARRDARQEKRRENTHARVKEKRRAGVSGGRLGRRIGKLPESRDAVPFGLKRRIPVGFAVLDREESRGAFGLAVPGEETRVVRPDRGVAIDDEEVVLREEVPGVGERARGPEDLGLAEEAQLREIRRAIAQVALDLVREVMEIDAGFGDPGFSQEAQMRVG